MDSKNICKIITFFSSLNFQQWLLTIFYNQGQFNPSRKLGFSDIYLDVKKCYFNKKISVIKKWDVFKQIY